MNLAPATATEHDWLGTYLQLNDTFYPTGSYAHSFGLETLVQLGVVKNREDLRAYLLRSVIPSLRQVELPLAAQTWRALAEPDWQKVGELSILAAALKTAKETRAAADQIGRQRAELLAELRGHPLAREYVRRAREAGWAGAPGISAALEGRVAGAPVDAVLYSVFYSTVASLLAASLKLVRIGQNGCQTLLVELLAKAPAEIRAAQEIPEAEIGWFNPWLDIAAARHEFADGRLFIS